jgi:hypothetical protein
MIINNEVRDVVKSDELGTSIKYSIDTENFGLLFKMLRDNLYQNKEYTIIREYVSNAIDAHTEAGVDKPVEIEWVDASELMGVDTQLIVRDFGCGLSPDRITNIFGKYLSSTKRNDNNSIGGFGIGSKSAFSYTDSYYVKTYYDGIEYQYNCYIDEDDLGSITLMFQQPTERGNGTEIIVPVKQRDKYLFEQAISNQLLFCNIEVKNMSVNLQKEVTYEDDDFILTNRSTELKLLNGKILYLIDLNNPQLDKYKSLRNLEGVVVKCNIGEVKVTLSREDLDYTNKTIELLKEKFSKVKEKLKEGYIESIKNCTTFREFNNLLEKQIKPKTKINSYDSHKIFTWEDFEDVVFNNYRPFKLIQEGYYHQIVNRIQSFSINTSGRKGYTQSSYFYRETYNPFLYVHYQEDAVWDKGLQEYLGQNARTVKVDLPSITPKQELVADMVYFCEDIMKEIDVLPMLSEKRDEYLQWRKDDRKANRVTNVRQNGVYPATVLNFYRWGETAWNRTDVTLTDKDFKDYVFIGNQEDKEKLEDFILLCKGLLQVTYTAYIVSVPNTKHFTQRRAIHIKNIMQDHPVIRRLVTNIALRDFSAANDINEQFYRHKYHTKDVSSYYNNIITKLSSVPSVEISSTLAKELKDVGLKNGWYNRDINLMAHYNNFMKGIELFKYVELNEKSLPLVKQYLRENGKLKEEVPVNQLKLEEIND